MASSNFHQNPTPPIIDSILSRRSIREGFDGLPLQAEQLDLILDCGLAAPSSKNSMPWRFHAVVDPLLLERIAWMMIGHSHASRFVPNDPATGQPSSNYTSTVAESAKTLRSASAGIFIENLGPYSLGVKTLTNATEPERRSALFGFGLEMFGIGAAVENMWLAAGALGCVATLMVDVVVAETQIGPLLGIEGDLVAALAVGKSHAEPVLPMDQPAMVGINRKVVHRSDDGRKRAD